MLLEERDRGTFKKWLVPKLETISDADAAVLADYVIALITVEGPTATVKNSCVEALSDFLQDHTHSFIDEVAQAIEQRSWESQFIKTEPAPSAPAPAPAPATAPIPSYVGPTAESYLPSPNIHPDPRASHPRTRTHGKDPTTRSSGGTLSPSGLLPARPVGSGSVPLPSGPRLPTLSHDYNVPNGRGKQSRKRKLDNQEQTVDVVRGRTTGDERRHKKLARRSDVKNGGGLGANGRSTMVPRADLMHNPALPIPQLPILPAPPAGFPPFDPTNPMAVFMAMAASLSMGMGLGLPGQLPLPPAVPLGATPQSDSNRLKLRCKDYDTKGVCPMGTMCPYAHEDSVPVPYDPNHASLALTTATNKYRKSRKDNDHTLIRRNSDTYIHDEDPIDLEEFKKQQAEAQKVFEERRKKIEAADAQAEIIRRQLETTESETETLRLQLTEKAKAKGIEIIIKRAEDKDTFNPLLNLDLSTMQAEAEGFYTHRVDSDTPTTSYESRTYRGGYQAARFRYSSTHGRGLWARGGYHGRVRSSVRRLDNRPKRIAIAGIEAGSRTDEAVRQYLQNVDGVESVLLHMERQDTLVVSFAERYMAEVFLGNAVSIPNINERSLSWVPNNVSVVLKSTENEPSALYRDANDSQTASADEMDSKPVFRMDEPVNGAEADLDVAEEDDQWL